MRYKQSWLAISHPSHDMTETRDDAKVKRTKGSLDAVP